MVYSFVSACLSSTLHTSRSFLFIVFIIASLTVPSATIEAQIYSWRDPNGTLVLSDVPLTPEATTVPVEGATSIRTTRKAVTADTGRYDSLIRLHAANYGVRADLVRAIIQVESGFNPRARSPKGAMGLMQLMPTTTAAFGVADPYNPGENIRGGVADLRRLLTRYEGNEELSLAAYNAGPTAVERYGNRVPPYRETREYVRKIRTATRISTAAKSGNTIYRSVDFVNGRVIPRYSNFLPLSRELHTTVQHEQD